MCKCICYGSKIKLAQHEQKLEAIVVENGTAEAGWHLPLASHVQGKYVSSYFALPNSINI